MAKSVGQLKPIHYQSSSTPLGFISYNDSRYGTLLTFSNLSVNTPQVIIITNSDEGWVKFSCERYIPQLLPVVEKYRIVSARTGYERFYPGQPLCWKAAAFAHEVNEIFEKGLGESYELAHANRSLESTDVSSASDESYQSIPCDRREVFSFGDSMEERTAVRIIADQLSAIPKSVMFVQSPTPTQIIGQLEIVTNHMKFLGTHLNELDLEISRNQADRAADSYMRKVHKKSERTLADDLGKMLIHRTASSEGSDIPVASG